MVLHKITKINAKMSLLGKRPKPIKWLVLGLNYKINVTLLQMILQKQEHMFENLMIKIVVPTSSEMMPKLFQSMSFVKNMEIDLNNKTIDFYEFPSQAVLNIKKLSFKKHSFNFEKLVELFEQIDELKIRAEEFQNNKQSLIRQKHLRKVSIECMYHENENLLNNIAPLASDKNKKNFEINYHVSLDSKFGLIFYDSSLIDLTFTFHNCYLELRNVLYHFGKLNCKSVTVLVDNLRFDYKQQIPSSSLLPFNQHQKEQQASSNSMLSHFIHVVSVKENPSHENMYVLKEMVQHQNMPPNYYAFDILYRQAVSLYDNDQMVTYLNPVRILAKNF